MQAIPFNGQNCIIAENQDEYNSIPAFIGPTPASACPVCYGEPEKVCEHCKGKRYVEAIGATFCFKLEKEEIAEIVRTGLIWQTVLTFGKPLQPQLLQFKKPNHLPE